MERAKIEEQESESHEPDALSFAPFFSQWHPPERNNPQHFPEDFLREFEKSIRAFLMNLVEYLDFEERIYFSIFPKKKDSLLYQKPEKSEFSLSADWPLNTRTYK
jgi:hypothetical protein